MKHHDYFKACENANMFGPFRAVALTTCEPGSGKWREGDFAIAKSDGNAIATCSGEVHANLLVSALNALYEQGKMAEIINALGEPEEKP